LPLGEQEINALKVKCNYDANGCDWAGELQSLDNHLATCEYALLRCTNKCTNNIEEVYVLRRDMDNHLKNTCPNRQYQCPHCKDTGRHCQITTTHLDTCPKFKIPCPNFGCDVLVPRCELLDHPSKCLFEKVPCKYAEIGCEEEPLRKDLQQHENNDTFHLHLAIETVNRQQKEVKALKEEQRAMKEEQRAMKEEQRAMKEEQRAMKEVMKDDIVHCQARSCVFKIPNFNQKKKSQKEWYSPPFYTHPRRYKMCIRVDADGYGDGEGTHVSVYAYLMRGKNDDNLSWPFRGEVTFTLLNQLEDKNHHTERVTYIEDKDDGANRRVVDGDRGPIGRGRSQFISHDKLGYYKWYNCQYLKDDCLYFRITANPSWLTCTT